MDRNQDSFLNTPTFACSDVEHVLDFHLDGEMISPLQVRFDSHLESCPDCRQMVHECELLKNIARTLRDRPIDPGVSIRLRAALKERLGFDPNRTRPNTYLTVIK